MQLGPDFANCLMALEQGDVSRLLEERGDPSIGFLLLGTSLMTPVSTRNTRCLAGIFDARNGVTALLAMHASSDSEIRHARLA